MATGDPSNRSELGEIIPSHSVVMAHPVRRAVIDVGTNSVKLLVADVSNNFVQPVVESSEQTRLGSGSYETHRLQPSAIENTARAAAAYAKQARECGATNIRIIATSAARDASNSVDLIQAIHASTGLTLEIISGEQEAEWAFRGVVSDAHFEGHRLLLLDVGGGSTQFIVGERGHHIFRQSFALGSVRLLEKLRPADPASTEDLTRCQSWLTNFFRTLIAPLLDSYLAVPGKVKLVGTGGTATILARMESQTSNFDRRVIDGTRLSRDRLIYYMDRLWSLSLTERKTIIGLPANRADIIPMGVAIYAAVMEHFRFPELLVSTRGLRFGAVLTVKASSSV